MHYLDRLIEEAEMPPKLPFPGPPPLPDTRMLVDDPETQRFLDDFRERYERQHGEPKPDGLWAHQLSPEERMALTEEEVERRVPPWQRELWAWLIAKAIQNGRIDDLPDDAIGFVMDVFGCPQGAIPPPKCPPPA